MKYIIVSDLHGGVEKSLKLFSMLERRGWQLLLDDRNQHPVLYHPEETLIVAGDSSDRGAWSVPLSYLFASSWVNAERYDLPFHVIPLMGNHDQRIERWALTGYDKGHHGFIVTLEQLMSEKYAEQADLLKNVITDYPYWFIGKHFIAVHAYWKDPIPSFELAMRGPTQREGGYNFRTDWWNDYEKQDRTLYFGHYHARCDMLFPEKNLYCIDNHDTNVFTYGYVDDAEGVTDLHVATGILDPSPQLSQKFIEYVAMDEDYLSRLHGEREGVYRSTSFDKSGLVSF